MGQIKAGKPLRDGRGQERAPSLLLLRHGHDRGGDPPAAGRRGDLLEWGRTIRVPFIANASKFRQRYDEATLESEQD